MVFNHYLLMFSVVICFAGPGLSKIVRPCALDDYECMGMNLAANSNCDHKVVGEVPSKFHKKAFNFEAPYFNASFIDKRLTVRNLDLCSISEFFVNTKIKRTVIGMECPNMDFHSDRTYILHKTYKEDSYHHYHIRSAYPMLRVTVNLPLSTDMDLCSAYVFTDVVELPKMQIDPQDKHTAKVLSTKDLSKNLNIFEREVCIQRGYQMAYKFVDAMICNYGC